MKIPFCSFAVSFSEFRGTGISRGELLVAVVIVDVEARAAASNIYATVPLYVVCIAS